MTYLSYQEQFRFLFIYFWSSPKDIFIDFRERKREREREKYWSVASNLQPKYASWLPSLGIELSSFGCAGMTLQPAELLNQG